MHSEFSRLTYCKDGKYPVEDNSNQFQENLQRILFYFNCPRQVDYKCRPIDFFSILFSIERNEDPSCWRRWIHRLATVHETLS